MSIIDCRSLADNGILQEVVRQQQQKQKEEDEKNQRRINHSEIGSSINEKTSINHESAKPHGIYYSAHNELRPIASSKPVATIEEDCALSDHTDSTAPAGFATSSKITYTMHSNHFIDMLMIFFSVYV